MGNPRAKFLTIILDWPPQRWGKMSCHNSPGIFRTGGTVKIRAAILLSTLLGTAHAASYNVLELNSPGPATRMSGSGAVIGSYITKCAVITTQPKRVYCYAAPWLYDGKHLNKLANAWPNLANAIPAAVNDALEIVGVDKTGAWYYSNGKLSYVDQNNPTAYGSRLYALNNGGVAVGMSTVSSVYRAITYRFNGLMETPLAPGHQAVDINDAGMIAGAYIDASNNAHSFIAEANGTITDIPKLDPAISCRPVRLSQQNANGAVWVAGNCAGNRPFLFELRSKALVELTYPGSSNLSVVSVNSQGIASGTAVKPGAYAPDGYTALQWSTDYGNPTDLNANNAFAPLGAWNVHATDINEAGTVLTGYNDTAGNFFTFLLTPQ
jgi:uncharacterized membrane protein